MDEKQLKTSLWQRIVIIVVALLLLGSTVLTYMFIVMGSSSNKQSASERIAELEAEYDAKREELQEISKPLGEKYFSDLQGYEKSQVKAFNAAAANSEKLKTLDLKAGTGRQLAEGDNDYMAYYIGWCPDGSLLDASYSYPETIENTNADGSIYYTEDKDADPTGLHAPLIQPDSLIDGWVQGIVGMKLGGVRQITIPGELAYGDTQGDKYCGMSNAPLKFIVMALETDEDLKKANEELNDIYIKLYTAIVSNGTN